MELFSLLVGADIEDENGNVVGEVLGFEYFAGKLTINSNIDIFEEEDPDPGEEADEEPEMPLLALVGGR